MQLGRTLAGPPRFAHGSADRLDGINQRLLQMGITLIQVDGFVLDWHLAETESLAIRLVARRLSQERVARA